VHLLRYRDSSSGVMGVGVLRRDTVSAIPGVTSLAGLWRLSREELKAVVIGAAGGKGKLADVTVAAPVDGRTEVWACGVTYEISREARTEESERSPDVYRQVYDADRPEVFFKSVAWRVVGDGEVVAVRPDSAVNVPEPELALVINRFGEIVGYTVCDDVSSRSIEGANPLYLPQAKSYLGACAVGPMVRPVWEVDNPYDLAIELVISRSGRVVWQGTASTARLHRRFDELIEYLFRADAHPDGVVLSTGTCLVPSQTFSLTEGDIVQISIAEVGVLTTGVVRGPEAMSWLVDGTSVPGRPTAGHLAPATPREGL
jgi:2-dehydro-3-deoxy-D-arabinonate dehydratase